MLAAAITCLLLLCTWGGQQYAWDSAVIIGLGAGAVALGAAFVARERRAPEPILPLRLFRMPVFDVVSAVLFLTTCAFFAAIVFMPLYFQLVDGRSATNAASWAPMPSATARSTPQVTASCAICCMRGSASKSASVHSGAGSGDGRVVRDVVG